MRFRKIVRALTSILFLAGTIVLADYLYQLISGRPSGLTSTAMRSLGLVLAFAGGIAFNHYRERRLVRSRNEENDHE